MVRLFRRNAVIEEVPETVVVARPVPPADPIELGFLLRSNRERLGLRLDVVRAAINVPVVDLDALERGQLELLHTQQAAVIALWRYAEHLGLEPSELVGVLRSHWPHRGLAVDAFISNRGVTPVAQLQVAAQLLDPISSPKQLGKSTMGLSEATKHLLEDGSAKRLFALKVLAPTSAVRRARLSAASPFAPAELGAGEAAPGVGEPANLEVEAPATAAPSLADDELIAEFVALTTPSEGTPSLGAPDEDPPADLAAEPAVDAVAASGHHQETALDSLEEDGLATEEPFFDAGGVTWTPEAQTDVQAAETHPEGSAGALEAEGAPSAGMESEPPEALGATLAPGRNADHGEAPGARLGVAEAQRRWGQHLAHFLADRLGLAPEDDRPTSASGAS